MSERKERVVRHRFLAFLSPLTLSGIALFLIAIATISVASPGPALTQITSAPPDPSASRAATFAYTNVFEVSDFECSLDGSPFASCGSERPSSVTYTGLADGKHAFRVRAVSDGTTGAVASYEWTVDLGLSGNGGGAENDDPSSDRPSRPPAAGDGNADPPGAGQRPGGDESGSSSGGGDGDADGDDGGTAGDGGGGDDGGEGGQPSPRGFTISGSTAPGDLLYPGGPALVIPLRIGNPNGAAIRVVNLAVSIDASRLPPGCRASWFRVTQSNVSSSRSLVVPARASVTLPAQGVSAPTIRMLDDGNQDACKRTTIHLRYSGRTGP